MLRLSHVVQAYGKRKAAMNTKVGTATSIWLSFTEDGAF